MKAKEILSQVISLHTGLEGLIGESLYRDRAVITAITMTVMTDPKATLDLEVQRFVPVNQRGEPVFEDAEIRIFEPGGEAVKFKEKDILEQIQDFVYRDEIQESRALTRLLLFSETVSAPFNDELTQMKLSPESMEAAVKMIKGFMQAYKELCEACPQETSSMEVQQELQALMGQELQTLERSMKAGGYKIAAAAAINKPELNPIWATYIALRNPELDEILLPTVPGRKDGIFFRFKKIKRKELGVLPYECSKYHMEQLIARECCN